jgi:hypothetical protein
MFIPPINQRGAHAAGVAALLAVGVTGCGVVGALTGAPASTTGGVAPAVGSAAAASATAGPTDQVGTCDDGTSSSAAYYATRFKAQVAAAVTDWAAAPPMNPSGGVPGQPGLHLVFRSVTTTSISTDNSSVNDTIPAVAAIAPEPLPTGTDYNEKLRSWLAAKPGWKQQASAAVAKARAVAGEVRAYQVVRRTNSGIYSCLSGAAAELGQVPGKDIRLTLTSDLENNEPIVGLSLGGARVQLVTVCPTDESTSCPQRFAAARSLLLKHGASRVEEISADALTPQTLVSFWRS